VEIIKIDQNSVTAKKKIYPCLCQLRYHPTSPRKYQSVYVGSFMRVPIIYEGLHEVCLLCCGDLHPIQAYPNLLALRKVEVIVEIFDASRYTKIHHSNAPNLNLPNVH